MIVSKGRKMAGKYRNSGMLACCAWAWRHHDAAVVTSVTMVAGMAGNSSGEASEGKCIILFAIWQKAWLIKWKRKRKRERKKEEEEKKKKKKKKKDTCAFNSTRRGKQQPVMTGRNDEIVKKDGWQHGIREIEGQGRLEAMPLFIARQWAHQWRAEGGGGCEGWRVQFTLRATFPTQAFCTLPPSPP